MKTLHIYDIDDTIFFANQSIIVLNDDGSIKEKIDMETYKVFEKSTDHNPAHYSWAILENAQDFYDTLKPNPIIIDQLVSDLKSGDDVVLLTGRTTPDDVEVFRSAFHLHGINLEQREIIFSGDNGPGRRSWINKRPEFEKLFQKQYDHIVVYDDHKHNLQTFWEVSLDYPFTTTNLNLVKEDGSIHKYHINQ